MKQGITGVLIALVLAAPALAEDKPKHDPAPGEIVNAAPASDWIEIAPEDLLVVELAPDAGGTKREVVIQLMPPPFSQGWVENIRTLAKAHWWDGTSVYRVQDNYVVQWGGGATDKKEPEGLRVMPESEYVLALRTEPELIERVVSLVNEQAERLNEALKPKSKVQYRSDSYAAATLDWQGWPLAVENGDAWPVHCYGMVGVARGIDNTGSGAELYTVIGQAPRQLDRNIAVVGRVIEGMEYLSSLPRGHGDLGFYSDAEAAKHTPITSVRLASELPENDRPRFEFLSTESDSFARYTYARANRHDDFFKVPAQGVDICNVPVPVRGLMEQ